MRIQLEGITMLSNDVARLARFYRDVLGFRIVMEEADGNIHSLFAVNPVA